MIDEAEALRRAEEAVRGLADITEGNPQRVEFEGDRCIVTFERNDPPGTRGPDYDAQVTLDAETGEVLGILGGS
jgi:hypothetical protein